MRRFLLPLALLILHSSIVFAQAGARHAVVIGNGEYSELGKLKNPVNDATDMAQALKELDFSVRLLKNADLGTMEDAIIRLGADLSRTPDSIGYFYYAGHGVQSSGSNYLIPADARIGSESFLKTKALSAQSVLDILQDSRNALNIIVLDACRDNPFSWARSGQRGLNVVGNQPPGSIIAYATSAGSVAQDGNGRNGVFTTELLKNLRVPDLEVKEVFNRTGKAVMDGTAGKQIPAVYSQFFETKYLAGAAAAPAPRQGQVAIAPTPPATKERTADLVVAADKPGAQVWIDGALVGSAPNLFPGLAAGRELTLVVRSGNFSASEKLTLNPNETREISLSLAMETGNIFFQIPEANAYALWIDGQDRGPLGTGLARDLGAGRHEAELRGAGLLWKGAVEVNPGVSVTVKAAPWEVANLEISMPDDAEARISGISDPSTGRAPVTLTARGKARFENIPAGKYRIESWGPGYERVDTTIALAKAAELRFEPWQKGNLIIQTEPSGASLLLDGKPCGNSPATLEGLDSSRSFTITAAKKGYESAVSRTSAAAGKTSTVTLTLKAKPALNIGDKTMGGMIFDIDEDGTIAVIATSAQVRSTTWDYAKKFWGRSSAGGYSDWTLPTIEQMMKGRPIVMKYQGLFDIETPYWCRSGNQCHLMKIAAGTHFWASDKDKGNVYLVRTFKQ